MQFSRNPLPYLDCVRVAGLTENFQESWVRNEEESWKHQPFLLEVASERLLADLELLQEVRQQLAQRVVTHAASHHIGVLMRSLHDLHPSLVDIAKSLGFLQMNKIVCEEYSYIRDQLQDRVETSCFPVERVTVHLK